MDDIVEEKIDVSLVEQPEEQASLPAPIESSECRRDAGAPGERDTGAPDKPNISAPGAAVQQYGRKTAMPKLPSLAIGPMLLLFASVSGIGVLAPFLPFVDVDQAAYSGCMTAVSVLLAFLFFGFYFMQIRKAAKGLGYKPRLKPLHTCMALSAGPLALLIPVFFCMNLSPINYYMACSVPIGLVFYLIYGVFSDVYKSLAAKANVSTKPVVPALMAAAILLPPMILPLLLFTAKPIYLCYFITLISYTVAFLLLWPFQALVQKINEVTQNHTPKRLVYGAIVVQVAMLIFCLFQPNPNTLEACNLVLAKNPTSAAAYFNRGLVHSSRQDYQSALQDFNSVLQNDPKHACVLQHLARIHVKLGSPGKALEYANRAVEVEPNAEVSYFARAITYDALGRYDDAIADFSKGIDVNPRNRCNNNSLALGNRANVYLKLGKPELALEDANKAIALNGNDATLRVTQAKAYMELKQDHKAAEAIAAAQKIDPTNEEAAILNQALLKAK